MYKHTQLSSMTYFCLIGCAQVPPTLQAHPINMQDPTLVDEAALRDAPVLPDVVYLVSGDVVHVVSAVKDILEATEYMNRFYKKLKRLKGDDAVFKEISSEKGMLDFFDELLEARAAGIKSVLLEPNAERMGKAVDEYLKTVLDTVSVMRRYMVVMHKFLVMQLQGRNVGGGGFEALEAEFLSDSSVAESITPSSTTPTSPGKTLTYCSSIRGGEQLETLIINTCYQLGRERRRLWQESGIKDDGTPGSDGGLEGGNFLSITKWLNPLKCGCGSTAPGYPTSPLLEQLVADLGELRARVLKCDGHEKLLVVVTDASLVSLDPEKVRLGDEVRFFRSELSRLEELILDATGLVGVQDPDAIASSRITLASVKRALNGLHKLLLSRFQELQETAPYTASHDYQELFVLCEAHLETIQGTERRLPE